MLRLFKLLYPIRNVFFIFGEGVLMFASVITASVLYKGNGITILQPALFLKAILIALICQTCLYHFDMYNVKIFNDRRQLVGRLAQALGAASIILSGTHVVLRDEIVNNTIFIISLGFIFVLVISWRFLYNIILDQGLLNKNIAVVGHSDLIETILFEISLKRDSGYNLIYLIPKGEQVRWKLHKSIATQNLTQGYADLHQTVQKFGISMMVADTDGHLGSDQLDSELLKCRISGITVVDGNSFFEMATGKLNVKYIKKSWLIYSDGFKTSLHHRFVKQMIDYTLSLCLAVLVLPLLLITMVFIKLDSRGPVLFSQERIGKRGKPYKMYKFRSMSSDAEQYSGPVWSGTNDNRVTRVGHYLRKWRVDELPQLFNVIKGDMSFVGPRPERDFFVNQLEMKIPYYGIRSTVKPGITGWAQVNYGYGASVEDAVEKLNYDLYYIKNASFLMDIFIVFKTSKTVIMGVDMGGK